MASKARKAFDANVGDIKRLLEIHADIGGDAKGRRYGLEVLNKSAIVLITAFWEAYCEDIASEALKHLIHHSSSASSLPKELKKQIAAELKKEVNDLAVWDLADDGWKAKLNSRLAALTAARNKKLNTPKSENIDELFSSTIGLSKISEKWKWSGMGVKSSRAKLDGYITLRGEVAHRGAIEGGVTKDQVEDYFEFIQKLCAKTGGSVNSFVNDATGTPLWLDVKSVA
jgi:hypothetical protein